MSKQQQPAQHHQTLTTKSGAPLGELYYIILDEGVALLPIDPADPKISNLNSKSYEPYLKLRLQTNISANKSCYHLSGYIMFPGTESNQDPRTVLQFSLMDKTLMFYWNFQKNNNKGIQNCKALKFTLVFDENMTARLKGTNIYMTCIHDDPEEGSTSQIHVSDVDEI